LLTAVYSLNVMCNSDRRFKLLFQALDGLDGNGMIEKDALQDFLFPDPDGQDDDDEDYEAEYELERENDDSPV
jgi:hypothetical protein